MALKDELPQGKEEQLAPPHVLAGGELEDNWHKSAGVLDANSLRGEVGEHRSFMEKQSIVEGVWRGHWGGVRRTRDLSPRGRGQCRQPRTRQQQRARACIRQPTHSERERERR